MKSRRRRHSLGTHTHTHTRGPLSRVNALPQQLNINRDGAHCPRLQSKSKWVCSVPWSIVWRDTWANVNEPHASSILVSVWPTSDALKYYQLPVPLAGDQSRVLLLTCSQRTPVLRPTSRLPKSCPTTNLLSITVQKIKGIQNYVPLAKNLRSIPKL